VVEVFVATLAVGLLGGVGSVLRHWLGIWEGFLPWGILAANSLASFIAGLALTSGAFEVALIVGLAGGLSTFSTFAAQCYELLASGKKGLAVLNAGLNLLFPAASLLTAVSLL
jgi:CrcB protein